MKTFFKLMDFAKMASLAKGKGDEEAFDLAWNEYYKVMAVTLKKKEKIAQEDIPILKPYAELVDSDEYDWEEWEERWKKENHRSK
jgi:hypothetical protein